METFLLWEATFCPLGHLWRNPGVRHRGTIRAVLVAFGHVESRVMPRFSDCFLPL
jgi:hypothetical protein